MIVEAELVEIAQRTLLIAAIVIDNDWKSAAVAVGHEMQVWPPVAESIVIDPARTSVLSLEPSAGVVFEVAWSTLAGLSWSSPATRIA